MHDGGGGLAILGPITLAALGVRTARNCSALALAVAGVYLLTNVRLVAQPLGFAFAFANCALFVLYIILAHRIAQRGSSAGVDGLGAAMLIALLVVMPIGLQGAAPALASPFLLAAGIAVGICSSVIPYVTDQLAMARLSGDLRVAALATTNHSNCHRGTRPGPAAQAARDSQDCTRHPWCGSPPRASGAARRKLSADRPGLEAGALTRPGDVVATCAAEH